MVQFWGDFPLNSPYWVCPGFALLQAMSGVACPIPTYKLIFFIYAPYLALAVHYQAGVSVWTVGRLESRQTWCHFCTRMKTITLVCITQGTTGPWFTYRSLISAETVHLFQLRFCFTSLGPAWTDSNQPSILISSKLCQLEPLTRLVHCQAPLQLGHPTQL